MEPDKSEWAKIPVFISWKKRDSYLCVRMEKMDCEYSTLITYSNPVGQT